MKIRKARIEDIPFLSKIIALSEFTGHEMYSYCSLFEKTSEELVDILTVVLNNEFEGHGLTYKNFYVAEIDNKLAGAMSFYLEGSNGDSNHLMTGALMQVINRKELITSFGKLKDFREIDIPKAQGSYQLDSVAVLEEYRGKGVFGALIKHLEQEVNQDNRKMEVQVWKNNLKAIQAYEKYGFKVEKTLDLRGNGRVLMIKG